MFAGVTTTAILVAFIADVLLVADALAHSAGRPQGAAPCRNHVIVGRSLARSAFRVVSDLMAAGYDVAVIESATTDKPLPDQRADRLDVPVIFGDRQRCDRRWNLPRIDQARRPVAGADPANDIVQQSRRPSC